MIPFLLYKKFSIDSDKSPEEVRRIMEAETKRSGENGEAEAGRDVWKCGHIKCCV